MPRWAVWRRENRKDGSLAKGIYQAYRSDRKAQGQPPVHVGVVRKSRGGVLRSLDGVR